MVNTEKLKQLIKDSGLKKSFLESELEIKSPTLRGKIAGVTEFKISEVLKLCELLKITDVNEMASIFMKGAFEHEDSDV